jgi:integrase
MVEDELAPKTIDNAVMLLRNMLAGRKGPSAFRRGLAFADHTLGVKLPPLEYRQIVPPTAEQAWKLFDAAREIGGVGYPITYLGAFCGLRRAEVLGLRFISIRWFDNEIRVQRSFRSGERMTEFTSGSGTSGLQKPGSRFAESQPLRA